MTQAFKRLICRVLIGVFVSAQFAMAAYACPGLSPASAGAAHGMPAVAAEVATTTGLEASAQGLHSVGHHGYAAMDPESPNGCMAHCQSGKQSADHTPAPAVSPALMTVMYTLPAAEHSTGSQLLQASLLVGRPPGASEPPHAILHCCFRD